MTSLRTLIRDAQAPHLLRRGILLDLVECKAFAFQQFAPTQRMLDIFHSGDRSQVTYDYHFPTGTVVINPPGGPAESRVIERESLAQCFEDGMALAESLDAEDWPHVTMTEIWGSHAPNGSACSYSSSSFTEKRNMSNARISPHTAMPKNTHMLVEKPAT